MSTSIEEMLLRAFYTTPDIAVIMKVEEGLTFRYVNANPAAFSSYGIERSYLNQTVANVHSRDYAEQLTKYYTKAVLSGEPVEFINIPEYLKNITNRVTATPIFLDGVCTHVFVLVQNISEQRKMEKKLANAEKQYQSLIHHNPDAIYLCDTEGILTMTNPAGESLLGYASDYLIGKHVLRFVPNIEMKKFLKGLDDISHQESVTFESYAINRFHERIDVTVKLVPSVVDGTIEGIFCIVKDISEQKKLYRELQLNEQLHRLITENVTDVICLMDSTGVVQYASPSYQKALGVDPAWYVGQQGRVLIHPEDRAKVLNRFSRALRTGVPSTVEYRKGLEDEQNYVYVETTLIPILSEDDIKHMLAVSHNISKRLKHEQALNQLAYTDPLTKLPNRRGLRRQIMEKISSRRGASPYALLFLDVDNFKGINDTFGHQFGDKFLVEIATRIRQGIREEDTVFRFAGDEFCVFLNETTKTEAATIAQRIIDAIQAPVRIDNMVIETTTSIGIALASNRAMGFKSLITMADKAMYEAKRNGKGKFMFYQPQETKYILPLTL